MKASQIGIISSKKHKPILVVECPHKGTRCLGKFRPSRVGQQCCVNCMFLQGVKLPMIEKTKKYFYL